MECFDSNTPETDLITVGAAQTTMAEKLDNTLYGMLIWLHDTRERLGKV